MRDHKWGLYSLPLCQGTLVSFVGRIILCALPSEAVLRCLKTLA